MVNVMYRPATQQGDPFGSIARQRSGSVGVHNGHQWDVSNSDLATPATFGAGADGSGYPNARQTQTYDGTSTLPVTLERPSVKIVRYEKITSPAHNLDAGYTAALSVQVIPASGSKSQAQAGWFQAIGYSEGANFDIGVYAAGVQSTGATTGGASGGSGGGLGVFAVAKSSYAHAGVGIQAIAGITFNDTGITQPYVNTGSGVTGYDCYHSATGTHIDGVGIQVRSDLTSKWDVGFAALVGSVTNVAFRDDSAADIGFGAFSDNATAAVYVLNNNANHYAHLIQRTSATAVAWGAVILANGRLSLDEFGVAQKVQIVPGTPGANKTCLYIQEGAGPTLRQVQTFDPGAAGANFTAGQLVLVAV